VRLFVDDLRACPRGWTLARTVTEAIRLLDTQIVDEVSLDHDISHVVPGLYQPFACLETFEPVARYLSIASMTPVLVHSRPFRVNIHTANPPAGEKMREMLVDAGYSVTVGPPPHGDPE